MKYLLEKKKILVWRFPFHQYFVPAVLFGSRLFDIELNFDHTNFKQPWGRNHLKTLLEKEKVLEINIFSFFSSPEHKVLGVSYCDRPMSIVCRPSSVNNFFKHLLNHRANLDETWQGCSLGNDLQKCSKNLIPSITLVAMATKRKKKMQNLWKSSSLKLDDIVLWYLV